MPIKDNENLFSICCDIFKALDLTMTINDISNVYCLQKKNAHNNSARPPIIIVKLSRQILRDAIINNRKIKSDFTTVSIGWPTSEKSIIRIRESLSTMNRRIYSAAFELRKNGKIKYLWIAGGKIFYKREEGSLRLQLFNLDDVENLK